MPPFSATTAAGQQNESSTSTFPSTLTSKLPSRSALQNTMRTAARSLSPFPRRRRKYRTSKAEIDFQHQSSSHRRSSATLEDAGLLETSAIEVVLESTPSPPPTPPSFTASTRRQGKNLKNVEGSSPLDTTADSSCSSEHSQEYKSEDWKRKSFKQKFMTKKTPPPSNNSNKGASASAANTKASSLARPTGNAEVDQGRNPMEARRCFPFSVSTEKGGRGRQPNAKTTTTSAAQATEERRGAPPPGGSSNKVSTPLRRRARSASRRRVGPPSVTVLQGSRNKAKKNESKMPLMSSHGRLSNDEVAAANSPTRSGADELPDPRIEERLVMRPRLLARLEDLGTPSPPAEEATRSNTPQQITLEKKRSVFSDVSTPSAIKATHPVVKHMEEGIVQASRQGKKIDRRLVYQTMLQIADSLESPEEQDAMKRELALLLQQDGPSPPPPPAPQVAPPKITVATPSAAPIVPQDTFSPELSENLGPAFTPPRSSPPTTNTRAATVVSPTSTATTTRVASKSTTVLSRLQRTVDDNDDAFNWFGEDDDDDETETSASGTSGDDTVDFLTDMFSFGPLFGRAKQRQTASARKGRSEEVRDDQDEFGEEFYDKEPDSWNNFRPPQAVVGPGKYTPPRLSRRLSRQNKKNGFRKIPEDQEGSPLRLHRSAKGSGSPDRRAWWRKKGLSDTSPPEFHTEKHSSSLNAEDESLSLSSIESQQYRNASTSFSSSPRRQVQQQQRRDVSPPDRHGGYHPRPVQDRRRMRV